jgi:hypothetical protein
LYQQENNCLGGGIGRRAGLKIQWTEMSVRVRFPSQVLKNRDMSHYCIIKNVKTVDGKELPVIMLDAFDEVWEFNSSEEAEKIAGILTKNSDSGYTYYVRKV